MYGDDNLYGGRRGNDLLHGHAGNDILYGGEGDDTYYFDHQGIDAVSDQAGNDTVVVESVSADGDYRFRKLYQDNGKLVLEGSGFS